MIHIQRILLGLALPALLLAGCGPSGSPVGKVQGKVVSGGQPVTGGTITFTPVAEVADARPATGEVQPDGTFVLTTQKEGDGAAVGKHQVSYMAPLSEVTETETGDANVKFSPLEGLTVKEPELEVKAGDNNLTIELVRGQ